MSVPSVCDRYAQSIDAVREFFTMFYGTQLTLSEDAAEEQLLFHVGAAGKIVVVTADFLAGFEPHEIREHLAAWNVGHLSRTLERGCKLVITSEGPEEERD